METFNPAAPDEYRAHDVWTKAQVYDEVIDVKGDADEHLKVMATRHGPVVRREGDKGYALRWTATEPGGLGGLTNPYGRLGKARNWAEFRNVLKLVLAPVQNSVAPDVHGV